MIQAGPLYLYVHLKRGLKKKSRGEKRRHRRSHLTGIFNLRNPFIPRKETHVLGWREICSGPYLFRIGYSASPSTPIRMMPLWEICDYPEINQGSSLIHQDARTVAPWMETCSMNYSSSSTLEREDLSPFIWPVLESVLSIAMPVAPANHYTCR